jgi:large subunit ribosomal protein L11
MSEEIKILNLMFPNGEASEKDVEEVEKYGIDSKVVLQELERKLAKLKGKEVKARLYIYTKSRDYYVEIIPPPVADVLLWKAGVKEPSGDPAHKKVGDISLESLAEVAIALKDELKAKTLRAAVKSLLGTARSIGLTVNGKDPKDVSKELESGTHDELLEKYAKEYELA